MSIDFDVAYKVAIIGSILFFIVVAYQWIDRGPSEWL
jgi:hypothetical protein